MINSLLAKVTPKQPEQPVALDLVFNGVAMRVETEAGCSPAELERRIREGTNYTAKETPFVIRPFCFSPGCAHHCSLTMYSLFVVDPIDVVARNPRAFSSVTHQIVNAKADKDPELPRSIPFAELEASPKAVQRILEQFHTRGWAVLRLPDEMRSVVRSARENGM